MELKTPAPEQPERPPVVLTDLLDRCVRHWPEAVAVDIPPQPGRRRRRLTYAQLGQEADTLARVVFGLIGTRKTAAVLLDRSTESLYTAQLGVLRAGCAHLCLDPGVPDAYLAEILADALPSLVLTDMSGELRLRRFGFPGLVLRLDRPLPPRGRYVAAPPAPDPETLAYLVYTSGTTGRPNGVMVAHRAITALIRSDVAEFALGPGDRVAQGSSSSYDSSIEETWLALASGATVVAMDQETVRLGPDLARWLRLERITTLCPPPTLLRSMSCVDPQSELPDLRLVYTGGEPLPEDVADTWSVGRRLVNGYGPTECTVTCVRQDIVAGRRIAIGLPVPGMVARVLGADLEPVGPGVPGELCMSGSGLAEGYLNRPDLTAQRFVEHPRYGRLYRTGDLVHREPDGVLVCHGRIDTQVKVRGHRIELEAVESVLARCPGVREAACRVQGAGQEQLLVAHIVSEDASRPPTATMLARRTATLLPSHMVPSRFGLIDELPRSTSGKLYRDALPELAPPEGIRRSGSPPGPRPGSAEARLVAAVAEVTAIPEPDVDADFFLDLGGTSLQAALLVSSLRAEADTSVLAVRDIYAERSIRKLAELARRRRSSVSAAPSAADRASDAAGDPTRATVAQSAWLLAELLAFSIPVCLFAFCALPFLLIRLGPLPCLLLGPPLLFALRPFLAPPAVLLAVAAKWALVGRYVAETVPAWSNRAVRMWAVRQVLRLVPWRTIAGTEYQSMVLRMLGARVGAHVHIHRGADLMHGGWDLLDIGDGVTVGQDAAVRLIQTSGGLLTVGPVALEEGSTLDVRAGVGPGVRVGAGARVTALSSVPAGAEVRAGLLVDGVPARAVAKAPPVPELTRSGRRFSPHVYGAALILAQSLLAAALALPYGLLLCLAVVCGRLDGSDLLEVLRHPLEHPCAVVTAGLLICAGLVFSLVLSALSTRWLGEVQPGVISLWSPAHIRVWLKSGLVQSAGDWLSGTLLWPRWLRTAGMTIGRGCEISTVIDVVPELVSIGADSFLADGVYLGGPRIHGGTVVLAPLWLGNDVFVGNHAVLSGASTLPDGLLIGVATPAPRTSAPGTSWFGHPAFELPRREVVAASRDVTHHPSAMRRVNRWFWELARLALPLGPYTSAVAWYAITDALRREVPAVWLPAVGAAGALGCATLLCGAVLALKWVLLGRVRPGSHPLWSCWCSRWDFLYVAWHVLAADILAALEGTLLLAVYLRRMGMRIGKRVVLGDGFAQVVDPDMIEIGHGATVSAMFQAHSFEDRVLKIDRIRIGDGATLAYNTVPLYGATIGDGALAAPHSVVMKREELAPGMRYEGVPTGPGRPFEPPPP